MRLNRPCVFCNILSGALPASVIYEDASFIVIMDAYPLTPGHVLIIPKAHHKHLKDLAPADQSKLFELGSVIMDALSSAGFCDGDSNLLLNDGKQANQTVPHIHLHVIPRSKHDFLKNLPKLFLHVTGLFGIQTKRATLDEQAKRIRERCAFAA